MTRLRYPFAAAPVTDAKASVARIDVLTGVRQSESQVRRTLHKLGMKYRKAAAQQQFDFFQHEMPPRLEGAAHFVMGAFLGMLRCFGHRFIKTVPAGCATAC